MVDQKVQGSGKEMDRGWKMDAQGMQIECNVQKGKGREGKDTWKKNTINAGPPSRAMVAGHLFQRSSAEGFSTMSKMHRKRHISRPPP